MTCSRRWVSGSRHPLTTAEPEGERLQKVLARVGIGSRRACEELIAAGRVRVDGELATLGRRIDLQTARVEVDGSLVPVAPDLVYYLLNKPDGAITTADDPQGRPTVMTLVPAEPRVFPVGRLDRHTEGLLILTNDGALSQLLTHPSHGVAKEYVAEVAGGTPAPGALRSLRQGIELEDGMTAPAEVGVLAPGVLRLVIHEGRNRRSGACAAHRPSGAAARATRIGPVREPNLPPGQWRPLQPGEVRPWPRRPAPEAHDPALRARNCRSPGPPTDAGRVTRHGSCSHGQGFARGDDGRRRHGGPGHRALPGAHARAHDQERPGRGRHHQRAVHRHRGRDEHLPGPPSERSGSVRSHSCVPPRSPSRSQAAYIRVLLHVYTSRRRDSRSGTSIGTAPEGLRDDLPG